MQDCREDWQSAGPTSQIFQSYEVPASFGAEEPPRERRSSLFNPICRVGPNRHAIDRGVPLVKRTAAISQSPCHSVLLFLRTKEVRSSVVLKKVSVVLT